jgi:hypothetical protein
MLGSSLLPLQLRGFTCCPSWQFVTARFLTTERRNKSSRRPVGSTAERPSSLKDGYFCNWMVNHPLPHSVMIKVKPCCHRLHLQRHHHPPATYLYYHCLLHCHLLNLVPPLPASPLPASSPPCYTADCKDTSILHGSTIMVATPTPNRHISVL